MAIRRPIINRAGDARLYEDELCPWLPEKIIDCHLHIGLAEHLGRMTEERLKTNWAMEVGVEQSWEQYREAIAALFPRQQVSALAMGVPFQETDLGRNNLYVISGRSQSSDRALFVTRPEWEPGVISAALDHGFVGIKPYPDLAPDSWETASIYDFLPKTHLEVIHRRQAVLVLHIPGPGRIADPNNIREIREISQAYPLIKLIVAHIGRAFCLPTAQQGLPQLADRKNLYFDTAANLNPDVLAFAIETVGPERILYGSDLPITLMRGVREHEGESYTNYTDGDYSWNTVRKPPEVEANYTYFLYEEIRALIEAVKRTGLGKPALEQVMYSNMVRLLNFSE